MAISLLSQFDAIFPLGEWGRIFNADYMARDLSKFLSGNGVEIVESDLWIDAGWFLTCAYGNNKFDILFAKYFENSRWELTIDPLGQPSFIKKIFGFKEKPYISDLKYLSDLIELYFSSSEYISSIEFYLSNRPKIGENKIQGLKWQ